MKPLVLLSVITFLTVALSMVSTADATSNGIRDVGVDGGYDDKEVVGPDQVGDVTEENSEDDDDDEEGSDEFDEDFKLDGIPFKYLTDGEIYELLDEDDNLLKSDLDIVVAGRVVEIRQAALAELRNARSINKRIAWLLPAARIAGPALFKAGRALFKGATRAGKVTQKNKSTITRNYFKSGNLNNAVKDFNSFSPKNVKHFTGNTNGSTGTVGKHRFTVRDRSGNGGPPTLEIRSPKPDGTTYVRKFRYPDN